MAAKGEARVPASTYSTLWSIEKVYIAITNPLIAQQTPAEYRDVYERVSNLGYEVQDGEARVNLQRTDAVRHILKCINKDIGTRMQSKAYKFISEVACSFAKTLEHAEEVSARSWDRD